jgi:DNA helicase-2/ATP-dependent DNA helicase PcrA
MTMHASKGLEFDYVFLPGIEEDILPHKKTIDQNEDLSEERRLFYVAITRAKKRLVMSYAKQKKMYNTQKDRNCSRFLQGLDEYFIYQDRTTLGHLSEEEAIEYKRSFFNDLSKLLD